MYYSRNESIWTLELLKHISRRLSSRTELKGAIYTCVITDNQEIRFDPNIIIFPSTNRRKNSDKIKVLEFVLNKYFSFTHKFHKSVNGSIVIDNGRFVPGIYVYGTSINKKYRRWAKLEGRNYEVKFDNN